MMNYKPSRVVGFAGSSAPKRNPATAGFASRQPAAAGSVSGFGNVNASTASPAPVQPSSGEPWGDDANLNNKSLWTPNQYAEWAPYKILAQLQNLSDQQSREMYSSLPAYHNARRSAYEANGPGGALSLLNHFRNLQSARAEDQGARSASMLRSQGIMGADAAAMLDAQNRASDATGAYAQDLYSPEKTAQRYMTQMQLMSPEASNPMLQTILALYNPAEARMGQHRRETAARQSSSGLGGILGTALGLFTGGGAGLGGIEKLFGGGGGGGGGIEGWMTTGNDGNLFPSGMAPQAPSSPMAPEMAPDPMTSLLPSLLPQQPQKTEEQAFEEKVQYWMNNHYGTPPFNGEDPAYKEAMRRKLQQQQGLTPGSNAPDLSGLLRWLTSQR